jgi:GTP-binding protein
LQPILGTVDAADGRQLVVADVPGLIEGASRGVGLGHQFLAHLERARLLVHVIDAAVADPAEQFRAIDAELKLYGAGLDRLPQVVVLNKVDLLTDEPSLDVDDPRILAVFRLSAATGRGVEEFRRALFSICPAHEEEPGATDDDGLADFLVYRPQPARRRFRIYRTDRGFRVMGDASEQELEDALRAAGIRKGTEVEVGGETLEWE